MAQSKRGQGLYRNNLSYLGLFVVTIGTIVTSLSILLQFSIKKPSPYIGIFSFIIFPGIVAFGVLLFFLGMFRESRRRKKSGTKEIPPYPVLDFNDLLIRRKFQAFTVAGTILIVLFSFVGYNAFLFTESVTFCGKLCHTVMQPEYTAYLHSPHARVACVDCHVGSGASWYVKSKLAGVHQIFAVLFHTYPTPIPTPIKNLRPARQTCEECHWPNKFYGAQLLQIPYFRYDKENTSDQISLLVKTGGGSAKLGQSAGIHYHMIISNTITFAATDAKLQDIPWIKVKGAYGQERVYRSLDHPISDKELSKLKKHVMDCMDCHNRPTHIFTPPDRAVDLSLNNGSIDKSLPWIKKTAADALMVPYPNNKTALRTIRNKIFNFYAKNYPGIYKTRQADIEAAVTTVSDIYSRSVFPKMKVNWRTYNNNIGHRNWPGCFRCHDGRHVTKNGKVLTHKCTACHTMPQRGPIEKLGALPPISNEPWHPFPLTGRHATILCDRCHRAGIRPSPDCATCHKHSLKAPMADLDCTSCHPSPGVELPIADCKGCHDDLGGLHLEGGHKDASCTACHKAHVWKVSARNTCIECHKNKKDHYAKDGLCTSCHSFSAE